MGTLRTSPQIILEAFYSREISPAVTPDPVRFEIEKERRLLDISSYLFKFSPLSMSFGRAVRGDDFLLDIYYEVGACAPHHIDMHAAAIASLRTVVERATDSRQSALLYYDGARRSQEWATTQPSRSEGEKLDKAGIVGARLLSMPFRFGDFARMVERCTNAHGPDSLLRSLDLEPGLQVFAYYRRTNLVAADVTLLLGQA